MTDLDPARGLLRFIDASPSPFHAVATIAARLEQAGFSAIEERDSWDAGFGRRYFVRGGSIVAWAVEEGAPVHAPFRLIGAHTDSPNLRVKPRPNTGKAGMRQLGVEVYGGVLLNSWLDRDLGLSGRVMLRAEDGVVAPRLFRVDRPLARVPQLAIHLDRDISEKGLNLNKQRHMAPVWSMGKREEDGFECFLAEELDVPVESILSWDAMFHDLTPSSLLGREEEFVAAPRLDNQESCFCGLEALLAALESGTKNIPMLLCFDHEEVGSTSTTGAGSPMTRDTLERLVLARGGTREDYHRALVDSVCVSSDMSHATHPNYVDRHEPDHFLHMNAGPVIKINANQRYATDADSEAFFQAACERAEVPFQKWVNRTDYGCGSTIGPTTAAGVGIRTVDVGNPQLSMHSARELSGSHDVGFMIRALTEALVFSGS